MVPAETVIVKGNMQDLQNVVKSYNVLIDYLVKNNMNYPCWKKEVYPNEAAL